jgi:hypothetical protein
MQKWEYLIVWLYVTERKDRWDIITDIIVEGKKLSDAWRGKPAEEFLNAIGSEGWELVSRERGSWVFKRPKA